MDDLWRGAFAGVCLVQSDYGPDLVEPARGIDRISYGAVQPDPAGGGRPEGITFKEIFQKISQKVSQIALLKRYISKRRKTDFY